MRRRLVAVLVAVSALVAAGCSDDDRAVSTAPTTAVAVSDSTTSTVAPEPVEPIEPFAGSVDDFYVVPEPLPPGDPGEIIRTQDVSSTASEITTRVMYHSVDADGDDRAVTAIVTRPVAVPPDGEWPVLAIAPGTVGLASKCALSRTGAAAPAFGVTGVRVATDYIGMGPVGETMPYLSRLSEGHSVLDGARAARLLVGEAAGTDLLIFGHSQGGHGAQSAHELAATYAPELDLLGTVSVAPAAMFDRTYGGVDDIVSRIVTTMGVYGLAAEVPGVDPADYLTPEALEVAAVLQTDCLAEITDAFVPLAVSADYWKADPRTTEPARSILLDNDVGNVATDVPMLLIGGTKDERVVEQRVRDLADRLCDVGQTNELIMLDGADHGTEVPMATDTIAAWFTARLAGEPAPDDCS